MSQQKFNDLLSVLSKKHNMTADQEKTLIQVAKVESGFDNDITGLTGDYGYMQITNPAQLDVNRVCKTKLDRFKDSDNIEIGFLFLFKVLPGQLKAYGVEPTKEAILGAYNCGAKGYSKNGNKAYLARYGLSDQKKKSCGCS